MKEYKVIKVIDLKICYLKVRDFKVPNVADNGNKNVKIIVNE